MAKKATPARARQLDTQMPMHTATSSGGKAEAQRVNRKGELAALRQEIKDAVASEGTSGKAAKVKAALVQIHAKFGHPEYTRAVHEFNITYAGVQDVNLIKNVSPSMGPIQ
jgi:hypothetical protein